MYCAEKLLHAFEPLFTLECNQLRASFHPGGPPAVRDRGHGFGCVAHVEQRKPALLEQSFVDADRREQEEADRAPHTDFLVRQLAGNDDRIREEQPAAGAQHAMPVAKHRRPIRQMVDGIVTEHGVERSISEWQAVARVDDLERNA